MCHFDEYGENEKEEEEQSPPMKQPTVQNSASPSQPENQKSLEFVEDAESITSEPLSGGWEKWEESGGSSDENEEEADGIGVHVESDPSQQIYYGSHQSQYNGDLRTSFDTLTVPVFVIFIISSFYF